MNTQIEDKKTLPRLIKGSSTYKLIVPARVEEKIRYLIRKFPSTEWSGVLFYTHTGTFENGDLKLTCEDFLPMDLGTGGWTEFKMNEDVAAYMAENIELFSCELGILHSHHSLGAFLSGQDMKRIQEDGNDTNCFLSLVVDTRGTYVAALTRKVQTKYKVTKEDLGTSYQFFGEEEVKVQDEKGPIEDNYVDESYIEYFMLDVEREEVNNPFDYLDARFKEIEEKKKAQPSKQWTLPKWNTNDTTENAWDKDHPKNTSVWLPKAKEPLLFNEEDVYDVYGKDAETVWESNEEEIHKCVVQMITCSFIVDSKKIDLKQWVTRHMANKYAEIFIEDGMFDEWCDFVVDFLLDRYYAQYGILSEDPDIFVAYTANAIKDELEQYADCAGVSEYIETYIKALDRHISF